MAHQKPTVGEGYDFRIRLYRVFSEVMTLRFSGGGMNCVSYDICVYAFWLVCVFFLSYSSTPE